MQAHEVSFGGKLYWCMLCKTGRALKALKMRMSLHQTLIDSVSIPNSPEVIACNSETEGEYSPILLGPTSPRSHNARVDGTWSRSRRNLLLSFCDEIHNDESQDSSDGIPSWEAEFR